MTVDFGAHGRHPAARRSAATAALALILAAGCAPAVDKFGDGFGVASSELKLVNGLSANGLSANGLSANGLSANGLSANGLGTTSFQSWFGSNPSLSDEVMTYVVRCALAAGSSLSYTYSGKSYTWSGALGLATAWGSGSPATTAEKQVVTACLAAHVNKFGRAVSIAVEGWGANGVQIPVQSGELTTYSFREGAFFGNVYGSTAYLYSCMDHADPSSSQSSVRACAFDASDNGTSPCGDILQVGSCSSYCTGYGASNGAYASCTYGGVTYKPITARMLPADVYTCGDGVCQVSEHCGDGSTASSCRSDCGKCN